MNNQACKVRPEIVNVSSNEPVFYSFSIKTSICSGSCININDPYDDKCQCNCKELTDKGLYDKRYTWNSSNCEFECDKSCDLGDYLDYEDFKCRNN